MTKLAVAGLSVRLLDTAAAQPAPVGLADYRLTARQTPQGEFAFFGAPEALPFRKGQQYQWAVELSAPGYQTETQACAFTLPATQPELVAFTRPVPGDPFEVRLFRDSLPIQLGTIELQPAP